MTNRSYNYAADDYRNRSALQCDGSRYSVDFKAGARKSGQGAAFKDRKGNGNKPDYTDRKSVV